MAKRNVKVDQHQLEMICRLNPRLQDVAAFFKCSEDTIERRCKQWGYKTFADCREQNMVHTRYHLVKTALKMAEKNPAMMIFCLKNLCQWKDRYDESLENANQAQVVVYGNKS